MPRSGRGDPVPPAQCSPADAHSRGPALASGWTFQVTAVELARRKSDGLEAGILWAIVRPAREDGVRPIGGIEPQIDGPGVSHPNAAEHRIGGEHPSQRGLGLTSVVKHIFIDDRSVGAMKFSVLQIAVINAVVEVAGMVLRRDEVDSIDAVGRIPGVTVDISESRQGQKFSGVRPVVAFIGRGENRRTSRFTAREKS